MAPRITTLNNGLRVVTEHMPTLKTLAKVLRRQQSWPVIINQTWREA